MTWIFLCYKVIRRCMQWLQIKNFWSCTCVSIFHTWFAMGREPAIQETDSSWLMHCTVSWSLIRPVERVEWGRRVSYLGPGPSRIPFWEFPGIWFSPNSRGLYISGIFIQETVKVIIFRCRNVLITRHDMVHMDEAYFFLEDHLFLKLRKLRLWLIAIILSHQLQFLVRC